MFGAKEADNLVTFYCPVHGALVDTSPKATVVCGRSVKGKRCNKKAIKLSEVVEDSIVDEILKEKHSLKSGGENSQTQDCVFTVVLS